MREGTMDREHDSVRLGADRFLTKSLAVRQPVRVVVDRRGYSTLTLDSFGLDRTGVLFRLVDHVYRVDPRLRPEHIAGDRAGDYYHLQLVYRHLDADGAEDIDLRMEAARVAIREAARGPVDG
jgi:hypothetical protein